MKKVFQILGLSSLFTFLSPIPAFAASAIVCSPDAGGQFAPLCALSTQNIGNVLGKIITFTFIAAVIIALFFLIYGGIKWITSGGDKTGVEEARNHVVAAIVGLVIVFLSYFIINLIVFLFTQKSLFDLQLPTL